MPITPDVLQRWAGGQSSNSVMPGQSPKAKASTMPPELAPQEDDPEANPPERNADWAGESQMDPTDLTPEAAEELVTWLQDNEPEIADAILELAGAISDDEPEMIEHAKEELAKATQFLNPEYPHMDDAQKEEASANIAKHMADKGHPEKDSPEWKQAVAIGLAQARKPKADEPADAGGE